MSAPGLPGPGTARLACFALQCPGEPGRPRPRRLELL
jgi:hypothetical protein